MTITDCADRSLASNLETEEPEITRRRLVGVTELARLRAEHDAAPVIEVRARRRAA